MEEDSVASVIKNLEGNLVRHREQGLEDLRRLLSSSRNGDKLQGLGDNAFHRILESIYRIIRSDSITYLSRSVTGGKTVTAASKLTSAATALRLTVEAGCPNLKYNTVKSLLDHISTTLITPELTFIEPLRSDYLKCVKIVLEYGPHSEHLGPKKWQKLVDFILHCIAISIGDDDPDNTSVSTRDLAARSGISVSFRTSQVSTQRSSRNTTGLAVDDLLGSLCALSALTKMPLMSRASKICDAIINCLSIVFRAQETALEILNNLTFLLLAEDLGLLQTKVEALIRIYRQIWTSKSSSTLRDQVLISLYSLRPLFLAHSTALATIDLEPRQQLLSTLLVEYAGRSAKDLLQFDEISLPLAKQTGVGFPRYDFTPTAESSAAMANWTQLEVITTLVLSVSDSQQMPDRDSEGADLPRKRRKTESPIHDLVSQASKSRGVQRLAALHALVFLAPAVSTLLEDGGTMMADLAPILLEDDPNTSNWAMLLFAKLVWSPSMRQHIRVETWRLLMEAARRSMSMSSKSRAGCLLLDAILEQGSQVSKLEISTLQEPFVSGVKHGPACLTDAALLLFTGAFRSGIFDRESVFEAASANTLDWLNLHWVLPESLDRVHNAHLASHAQPELLCQLLAAITRSDLQAIVTYHRREPLSIARARAVNGEVERLVSYLQSTANSFASPEELCLIQPAPRQLSSETSFRIQSTVSEFLISKIEAFTQACNSYSAGRLSGSSIDIAAILTSAFVTVRLAATTMISRAPSMATITESSLRLWSLIEKSSQHNTEALSRLTIIAAKILRMRDIPRATQFPIAKALDVSTIFLAQSLRTFLDGDGGDDASDPDIDMMDPMDSHPSQRSRASQEATGPGPSRRDLTSDAASTTSPPALRLDLLLERARADSNGPINGKEASKIMDEISDMEVHHLISARSSVLDFLDTDPRIDRSGLAKLLKALASKCLQDYRFERNDVIQCFITRIMTRMAPIWASSEQDDDLTDAAYDIYEWLIDKILAKGAASSNLKLSIAEMLDKCTQLPPSFANDSLPSPRTSLLNILRDSSNLVRFGLSPLLVHLFDRYVLTEHEAIFNDVVESLPSDLNDLEGVAVRFYLLSELGAKWSTILRHATYHLFETAVHVPRLQSLGRYCVEKMSKILGLDTSRRLFELFAPQIFYTWLGDGILNELPYAVFQYSSVSHLLSANRSEITAQIALRGGGELAKQLGALQAFVWPEALREHFAQAEAYCLASQISLPESEQLYPGSESRLRKDVGSDLYCQKLAAEIPAIVGHLIRSLQDDRGVDRAFEKNGLRQSLIDYKQITHLSASTTQLPVSQQPFFRAKFLVDELQWLCDQTGHTISGIWTPSVLVYLYRTLLLTADPAMGALQTCSALRKIKIIVSLGGPNASAGYPLEMLLHNLRPYLTIFQCSEDAIGIYWFLLERGKEYLSTKPSFVLGLMISVFSALSIFVRSVQDSTTQESHFIATMTQAQEFKAWLGNHLSSLRLQDHGLNDRFQEIISHAKEMTGSGSNSASSHEGMLLISLLKDRVGSSPMITESHFDLSIRCLCKDFMLLPDADDDILRSPDECSLYAETIRDVMKRIQLSEKFCVWAAQVIGRACLVHGPELESPTSIAEAAKNTEPSLTETASYSGILRCLESALWQDHPEVAASAEQVLQAIASRSQDNRSEALTTSRHNFNILTEFQDTSLLCPQAAAATKAQALTLENWRHFENAHTWCINLVVSLCAQAKSDPILDFLGPFACTASSIAPSLVPFVVHLVLSGQQGGAHGVREKLSGIFAYLLTAESPQATKIIPTVLNTILYLRRCQASSETTLAHRNTWLEIDFGHAAEAAVRCHLWETALLCIEIKQAQQHLQATRSSRRSTQTTSTALPACLESIYQNVDDPDFFYASHHDADMQSIIKRLAHESAGQKMLSFQSAVFDSVMRSKQLPGELKSSALATIGALSAANMHSISQAVDSFASRLSRWHPDLTASTDDQTKHGWNIAQTDVIFNPTFAMDHLRTLATATDIGPVIDHLERGIHFGVKKLAVSATGRVTSAKIILPLAILTEAKNLLVSLKAHGIDSSLKQMSKIRKWGQRLDFEDLSVFLECREYIFGMIHRNDRLAHTLGVTKSKAMIYEAQIVCQSLQSVAQHDSSQFQLSRAAYLSRLAKSASEVGVRIGGFSQYYLAKIISSHGETSASVDILRSLSTSGTLADQDLVIDSSEILSELGQQVSAARLEPPDEIIAKYLQPAHERLTKAGSGLDASRVFHFFAAFCDTQLQDSNNRDDYSRTVEKRALKLAEIEEFRKQYKKAEGSIKKSIGIYLARAESWYKIYNDEYQQKMSTREEMIERCLENYLRSMTASDDFPNDKLRFLAIWLDAAESSKANDVVSKHIKAVPSWKFATLVNQLVSRLADTRDDFQQTLTDLMFRISSDHPHHSLYQLFAVSKWKNADGDEIAASRHRAAGKVTETILKKSVSGGLWVAIHNCGISFVRVAQAKLPEKKSKFDLKQLSSGPKLIDAVEKSSRKIPPPAMKIEIRVDKDYSAVPVMFELQSQISIAGGVSAPKITTALASDGSLHKMLLKAGNDDLRQDSIMEQVFEQVSNLLSDHRSTRQRKLGIRTYKVVPLVVNAGIIEFVQGTIPLHDFLLPAHTRYFPKDYNPKRCRSEIADADKKPFQQRLQAYRTVTTSFHPVMRFFFMENFLDPDEWFYKRLNYSRSTAAISILGHVLGLGDRHGHNILLDKITGEVVHIDLGVAFEAGRILPIPEVVPFRLTRDLVDGMGISGVEGVFRRCCNFTLDALRQDQESIMTLLDVLRYDPLVSWSISPSKMRKMQENADTSQADDANGGAAAAAAERASDEPNEADRALTVVREKLGKSLSVEAEVNELIRQATDEKRLAVLFAGWGAYA